MSNDIYREKSEVTVFQNVRISFQNKEGECMTYANRVRQRIEEIWKDSMPGVSERYGRLWGDILRLYPLNYSMMDDGIFGRGTYKILADITPPLIIKMGEGEFIKTGDGKGEYEYTSISIELNPQSDFFEIVLKGNNGQNTALFREAWEKMFLGLKHTLMYRILYRSDYRNFMQGRGYDGKSPENNRDYNRVLDVIRNELKKALQSQISKKE